MLPHFWHKNVLVACSGGVDSMVLTHYLLQKKVSISLAHVNFKLRDKESDGDEQFVKHFAQQHQIPFFTTSFDTASLAQKNKRSIQETARNLRYEWFENLAKKYSFDLVVTAHHLDDQIETFLFHTFRGTGIKGLSGIPAVRLPFFRPFLSISKNEILTYAHYWKLTWREDKSNNKTDYTRNAIRHLVLPQIKSVFSDAEKGFSTTLHHLNNALQFYQKSLDISLSSLVQIHENHQEIDIEEAKQHEYFSELIYHWLAPFGFKAWTDIQKLPDAETGKQILSGTHRVYKNRTKLVLEPIAIDDFIPQVFHTIDEFINSKKNIIVEKVNKIDFTDRNTIFVDPLRLKFPLILRKWQNGDWFIPKGMCGKKRISRFFIDQKFSLTEKNSCLILSDAQSVIWVVGQRQDQRFVVVNEINDRSLLKISVSD
jgi:tRNA(Ile)-lysidine synthase